MALSVYARNSDLLVGRGILALALALGMPPPLLLGGVVVCFVGGVAVLASICRLGIRYIQYSHHKI